MLVRRVEGYGFFGGGGSLYRSRGEDPGATRARKREERTLARRAAGQLDAVPKLAIHPSPEGGAFRSYFVFRGAIESATEIDGYSTYVGGTARCVEAILDDQRLEALRSSTGFRFDLWSDRVNPRPPGMRER